VDGEIVERWLLVGQIVVGQNQVRERVVERHMGAVASGAGGNRRT
jgi:hypothetical protein